MDSDIKNLSIKELLDVLDLYPPVQRGTIRHRVAELQSGKPANVQQMLNQVQVRLLNYMDDYNLTAIIENENNATQTSIQVEQGGVAQNIDTIRPTYSYPTEIISGDLNPIRKRTNTKILIIDSARRKRYIAGDGVVTCEFPVCSNIGDAECISNCLTEFTSTTNVSCTNWQNWIGFPQSDFIRSLVADTVNVLPNRGFGTTLPCKLYEQRATDFDITLPIQTKQAVRMGIKRFSLPLSSVFNVPSSDTTYTAASEKYFGTNGCEYYTDGDANHQKWDTRNTLFVVDESTIPFDITPVTVPAGYYPTPALLAKALNEAFNKIGLSGSFTAIGGNSLDLLINQRIAIGRAVGETKTIWFVPPPAKVDNFFITEGKSPADCPGLNQEPQVCSQNNIRSNLSAELYNSGNAPVGFLEQKYNCTSTNNVIPKTEPLPANKQPTTYDSVPGSLGWTLGFRVARLGNQQFNALVTGGVGYAISPIDFRPGPDYLLLEVNDFNNNYYASYEGIDEESLFSSEILAEIPLITQHIGRITSDTGTKTETLIVGQYSLIQPTREATLAREYFGPVRIERLHVRLLDPYGNVVDIGKNNFSFSLGLEVIYNL